MFAFFVFMFLQPLMAVPEETLTMMTTMHVSVRLRRFSHITQQPSTLYSDVKVDESLRCSSTSLLSSLLPSSVELPVCSEWTNNQTRAVTSVPDRGLCTIRCQGGYQPSINAIRCVKGTFQPQTFACFPNPPPNSISSSQIESIAKNAPVSFDLSIRGIVLTDGGNNLTFRSALTRITRQEFIELMRRSLNVSNDINIRIINITEDSTIHIQTTIMPPHENVERLKREIVNLPNNPILDNAIPTLQIAVSDIETVYIPTILNKITPTPSTTVSQEYHYAIDDTDSETTLWVFFSLMSAIVLVVSVSASVILLVWKLRINSVVEPSEKYENSSASPPLPVEEESSNTPKDDTFISEEVKDDDDEKTTCDEEWPPPTIASTIELDEWPPPTVISVVTHHATTIH